MEKVLLTVTEAARRLSLGRATAYQLVRQGDLPSVRIGRAVRVPAHELEAWIEARVSGGVGGRFVSNENSLLPPRWYPARRSRRM